MDLDRLAEATERAVLKMARWKWEAINEHVDDPGRVVRKILIDADLANGERVEPDYEAALTEYLRLRWAEDGLGPYAEELADEVLSNGVKVPRISNFEEAKRIVDAAIGGKLLVDYPKEG